MCLVPNMLAAQGVKWYDRLQIRESLDTKLVPQPAFLTILMPEDKERTTSAGIGLQYTLGNDVLEWGPTLEYAKNTATDKEQDSLKAGLAFDWHAGDLIERPVIPLLRGKASFARDGVKDTEGLQFFTSVTPLFRARGGDPRYWYVPNIQSLFGRVAFLYSPSIGFEHDNVSSAPTDAATGSVTRWYWRVGTLVSAGGPTRDRVEITVDFASRDDIAGDLADGTHDFFQSGINVFFYRVKDDKRDRAAGIGFAYVNGEDPTKGFQAQTFKRVSFILRWK
jgi:hypothetical protein